MDEKKLKIILAAVCTFNPGVDRTEDGYGYLVEREPETPCESPCDYCLAQAKHILWMLEEDDANHQERHEPDDDLSKDRRDYKRY